MAAADAGCADPDRGDALGDLYPRAAVDVALRARGALAAGICYGVLLPLPDVASAGIDVATLLVLLLVPCSGVFVTHAVAGMLQPRARVGNRFHAA